MRPGPNSAIDAFEAVEKNHDVSFRIDETQKNSTAFEEIDISKWAKGEECYMRRQLVAHFTAISEGTRKDWESSSFGAGIGLSPWSAMKRKM